MAYDLRGHYIPEKYLAGLPKGLREQRIRELTALREGRLGYAELASDREARRKGITRKGQYTEEAERRGIEHRGDFYDTAERAFEYYGITPTSSAVERVASELEKIYKKGLAAWQTGGHRPGASQRAWGYARIASVLTGGKAAYTADRTNVARFPKALQRGIHAERLYEI